MVTRADLSAAEEYEHGHTALMIAALDGKTERVRDLIRQGADINRKDDNGRTALMFAVMNGHHETVNALLESGADVNVRSNPGGTALMQAALAGDLTMVEALLESGADVHARLPGTNDTAATLAARYGNAEIARLLGQID